MPFFKYNRVAHSLVCYGTPCSPYLCLDAIITYFSYFADIQRKVSFFVTLTLAMKRMTTMSMMPPPTPATTTRPRCARQMRPQRPLYDSSEDDPHESLSLLLLLLELDPVDTNEIALF